MLNLAGSCDINYILTELPVLEQFLKVSWRLLPAYSSLQGLL